MTSIRYNWSEEKILVADDDHYSYLLLEKILKRTGAQIVQARDGKEAIEACCKDKTITIGIIDIRMPYYDGFQVVNEVLKCRRDIIFIAQTADIFRLKKENKNFSVFTKVFQKPFLPALFLEEVHHILIENNKMVEITDNP